MTAYQKIDHIDFSVPHLAVHFRKLFINTKFLFHVWCISPNSIENVSDFCGRNSALLAGISPENFRSKS